MLGLQHAAAELAFLRDQVTRGVVPWDRLTAARESALVAEVARRRGELSTLGG